MKTPFIVVDGLDGCGKGTQLQLLLDRISSDGRKVVFTREPGGVPLSEEIRKLFKSELGLEASALTQSLLMWAARRNYLEKQVWPALENGTPVFSDRGDSSTLAYQVYAKNAPDLEQEFWRMRTLVFGNQAPTLYIFLDVPPGVAYKRTHEDKTRGEISHFDAASLDFYERVRKGFFEFERVAPASVFIIDGNRPPEEIQKDFYRIVSNECGW